MWSRTGRIEPGRGFRLVCRGGGDPRPWCLWVGVWCGGVCSHAYGGAGGKVFGAQGICGLGLLFERLSLNIMKIKVVSKLVVKVGVTENIDVVANYYDKLLYRMRLTKGARFQAARRHKRRSIASTWAVTVLSLYVFSSSSYLALYDLSNFPTIERPLLLSSIILSAFIIAFTVFEQGKRHDLKAELFLRCSQGIQELHDRLEVELLSGKASLKLVSSIQQFASQFCGESL